MTRAPVAPSTYSDNGRGMSRRRRTLSLADPQHPPACISASAGPPCHQFSSTSSLIASVGRGKLRLGEPNGKSRLTLISARELYELRRRQMRGKQHIPTAPSRLRVREMTQAGATQPVVAAALGIEEKCLRGAKRAFKR